MGPEKYASVEDEFEPGYCEPTPLFTEYTPVGVAVCEEAYVA